MKLLDSSDDPPAIVHNAGSAARFVIICDHAGRAVPRRLGSLGLAADAFERHIAWDIGAAELSLRLGEALGACVIQQRYSRLVIDCNRAPGRPDSIPTASDGTPIPGNAGLDVAEIAARVADIHSPYHAAIRRELDARTARGQASVLVFVHSFTPRLAGQDRPWHFGVLHEGSSPFSRAMLTRLAREPDYVTGDNQPYAMDGTDYSAPLHATAPHRDYLELEVRQDLLIDPLHSRRVADLFARLLPLG